MANKKKGTSITIVAEDQMLDRFIRECLILLGYDRRKFRVKRAPKGEGSGKQWADNQCAIEVKILRSNNFQSGIAVLVGTEVDELTIAKREKQLIDAMKNHGMGDRKQDERIAFWLPTWSIETWILQLAGETVDEKTKYKHRVKPEKVDYKAVAKAFVESYRDKNDFGLESIAYAHSETPRIEP